MKNVKCGPTCGRGVGRNVYSVYLFEGCHNTVGDKSTISALLCKCFNCYVVLRRVLSSGT